MASATAPSILAQLSDPHVRVGPDDEGSAAALAAAVEAVERLEPPADAVIVTGDIANDRRPREYERATELLAPLTAPVHVLPGNHDDRAALRGRFAVPGAPGDRYEYAMRCGDLRVVACDTTLPGRDEGCYDAERRAWLREQLAAEPATPTLVAMHHPPLDTGIATLDAIGLPRADRDALAELMSGFAHVQRVAAGHVHRGAFDVLGGCGVVACPSTNIAVRLRIGGDPFELTREPPAFVVHALLGGERLVSHLQPIPPAWALSPWRRAAGTA
jgi:3',5'-cyclic-AMP phosphodiesterase